MTLTPREKFVLRKIADGWTRQEIASHDFVSVRTIDDFIAKLYRKFNIAGYGGSSVAKRRKLIAEAKRLKVLT